jgi:hypothetical protein
MSHHTFSHLSYDIYLTSRNENTIAKAVTTFARSLEDSETPKTSSQSSARNTKLSVGLGLAVGLLLFAAFWALAFVLWTRRNDRKKALSNPQMTCDIDQRRPRVPEKGWSISDDVRTLQNDLDVMIDQCERPWGNRPVVMDHSV